MATRWTEEGDGDVGCAVGTRTWDRSGRLCKGRKLVNGLREDGSVDERPNLIIWKIDDPTKTKKINPRTRGDKLIFPVSAFLALSSTTCVGG